MVQFQKAFRKIDVDRNSKLTLNEALADQLAMALIKRFKTDDTDDWFLFEIVKALPDLKKNIKKHKLHFEDSVELTMLIQPARNQLSQLVQLIPATKMCWCTNSDHLDDGKSEHREEIGCRFNGLFGLSADGLAHLWVVGVGEIGETLIW